MSTKSTVFLTRYNEHCYTDCAMPREVDGKYVGDDLTLEIDKESMADLRIYEDSIVIDIKAGTHIWKVLKQLRNIDEDTL